MAFKWISTSSRFRNSSGYVFFNSLLVTFFVLHKSQFPRLTSELPHARFQLNGF